ncbi:MAG: hypothetical protein M3401_12865 [Actinomycetota bacterium]|nr:hypothetical protein [Actinomycetota bacterium]
MAPSPLARTFWRPSRSASVPASLLGVLLMLVLLPGAAPASSPGKTLGVYAGPGAPDKVAKFESSLGRNVSMVHDALARENWTNLTDVSWWTKQWAPTKYFGNVMYSIPMLPDTGGSLAAGAAGDYNAYFRTLAERFVAGGQGSATLRLGPEFNGNWFKWTINVPNGGANYAAYWRQIVNTMRSVPGAKFKFDWCVNAGSSWVNGTQMKAESAWPGDAYVDFIGADIYDQSWIPNYRSPEARWKDFLKTGNGLNWHRDFAKQKGKPMTFPEWGIANRYAGNSGGDAPYFIERMHDWIRDNDVAYHMYFEWADPNGDYRIFNGKTPNAAKRFKELFGNDGGASAGSSGSGAAKLNISRVGISRGSKRLTLRATLAPHASGSARVTLSAGGRRTSFKKKISNGRLKISRKITRPQARRGTGTVTVMYAGNAQTRPQKVRLRVAPGNPKLRLLAGPRIDGSRLSASGRISTRARGTVRVELHFDVAGNSVTRAFKAKISKGRWRLATELTAALRNELAQRSGSVSSYAIFGGSRRVSGAMKLYDVLGSR